MHEGHRSRMLAKLEKYADSLSEHELLEVLLYFSIPRVNTNPIAHRLLSTFGSIDRVFDAEPADLVKVEGVGPATASFLKCIGSLFSRYKMLKEDVFPRSYNSGFVDYLISYYKDYAYEVLVVWFLDRNGKILLRKTFTSKERENIYVDPTEITKCIGNTKCRSILLTHNHVVPGVSPSDEDDEFTKQCEMLFSLNNIVLLDHYIVSGDQVFSYFKEGKLKSIVKGYHVHNILKEDK